MMFFELFFSLPNGKWYNRRSHDRFDMFALRSEEKKKEETQNMTS